MLLPSPSCQGRLPDGADSRDLSLLEETFQESVRRLAANMARVGVALVPYFTVRGPRRQGQLWCQSRSVREISVQREILEAAGAPKIASYLDPKYSATGRPATHLLPGQSWHQWGTAMDCFHSVAEKSIWRGSTFDLMRDEAEKLGLVTGAAWFAAREPNHVQLGWERDVSVARSLTFRELEVALGKIYDIGG